MTTTTMTMTSGTLTHHHVQIEDWKHLSFPSAEEERAAQEIAHLTPGSEHTLAKESTTSPATFEQADNDNEQEPSMDLDDG